jgi:hypothetical protein
VALAGVTGAIGGDRSDLPVFQDLVQQFREHRGIANIAAGDLDSAHLQRPLVDSQMDFTPHTPAVATVLARRPFAFVG